MRSDKIKGREKNLPTGVPLGQLSKEKKRKKKRKIEKKKKARRGRHRSSLRPCFYGAVIPVV